MPCSRAYAGAGGARKADRFSRLGTKTGNGNGNGGANDDGDGDELTRELPGAAARSCSSQQLQSIVDWAWATGAQSAAAAAAARASERRTIGGGESLAEASSRATLARLTQAQQPRTLTRPHALKYCCQRGLQNTHCVIATRLSCLHAPRCGGASGELNGAAFRLAAGFAHDRLRVTFALVARACAHLHAALQDNGGYG